MRRWLLAALAVLALGLLFACTPVEATSPPAMTGVPQPGPAFPTLSPGEEPRPTLMEKRLLILEWPRTIREKQSELIVLTIAMDEDGSLTLTPPGGDPVEIPDLFETHTVQAIARLDLAGMEAYRDEIREPLLPGKPVTFRWSIRPNEAGVYRGVVWLRLEFLPRAGGAPHELLLMARPIEIQAVTVWGLPADLAAIFGGLGLVTSTLLGFPFISRWVEDRLKRRSPPPQQAPPSPTPNLPEPGEGQERKP